MNSRFLLLPLLAIFFFVSACKKQNDNVFLANEATQGFDGYSFTDTFKLLTTTIREDSLKSDSLSHNLVGVINDATFGLYKASSYLQFKLPQFNNVINTGTLDSAVLYLQYTSPTSYYGDLNTDMSFEVFEMTQDMNSGVTHSNQSYTYAGSPSGTFSAKFKPGDSIYITELGKPVKVAPCIAIKLSNALAGKLFNATAADLQSQQDFITFFKGLAIVPNFTPAFGSGAIAAFNLNINQKGIFSKIRLYYNDSLQSDFVVTDESRRFTKYEISNQNNSLLSQKSSGAYGNFDTTYAMAMTGAKTRIKIPGLFGIVKNNGKKISIGKAEVIIRPLAGTFASPFTLPSRLLLLQPNADNNLNAGVIDLVERFYGGDYDAVKNEYRFNITRHIQSLFSDFQLRQQNNNLGLFLLVPTDYPIAPSRIIIDTRKGIPNAGIEFRLVYTEL